MREWLGPHTKEYQNILRQKKLCDKAEFLTNDYFSGELDDLVLLDCKCFANVQSGIHVCKAYAHASNDANTY